jgi:hypothetical protein
MASRRSRPRRFLLPVLLAAVLAAEITGLALARSLAPSPDASPPAPAAAGGQAAATAPVAGARATAADSDAGTSGSVEADGSRDPIALLANLDRTRSGGVVASPPAVAPVSAARVARVSTRPAPSSSTTAGGGSAGGHGSSATYRGTNHVWIPSLGVNKGVQSFPCSRNRPPDAGVYRWGCAGRNNVYLLSHAWSTFKPLHDAYVGGRLRKGMKVVYADGASRVHTYAVIWWKVTAPTTAASWAWASLRTPRMTLQTCVGSRSQYRLMVRLVQVG